MNKTLHRCSHHDQHVMLTSAYDSTFFTLSFLDNVNKNYIYLTISRDTDCKIKIINFLSAVKTTADKKYQIYQDILDLIK